MAAYYFDSSALVKYYHREPGWRWVEETIDAHEEETERRLNLVYLAEISIVETAAALAQLTRTGRINAAMRDALFGEFLKDVIERYRAIHVTRELVDSATQLTRIHPLRGYDAVQLAVGAAVERSLKDENVRLVFVSSDNQLLKAAQAEGLETVNPLDHVR